MRGIVLLLIIEKVRGLIVPIGSTNISTGEEFGVCGEPSTDGSLITDFESGYGFGFVGKLESLGRSPIVTSVCSFESLPSENDLEQDIFQWQSEEFSQFDERVRCIAANNVFGGGATESSRSYALSSVTRGVVGSGQNRTNLALVIDNQFPFPETPLLEFHLAVSDLNPALSSSDGVLEIFVNRDLFRIISLVEVANLVPCSDGSIWYRFRISLEQILIGFNNNLTETCSLSSAGLDCIDPSENLNIELRASIVKDENDPHLNLIGLDNVGIVGPPLMNSEGFAALIEAGTFTAENEITAGNVLEPDAYLGLVLLTLFVILVVLVSLYSINKQQVPITTKLPIDDSPQGLVEDTSTEKNQTSLTR